MNQNNNGGLKFISHIWLFSWSDC